MAGPAGPRPSAKDLKMELIRQVASVRRETARTRTATRAKAVSTQWSEQELEGLHTFYDALLNDVGIYGLPEEEEE